MITKTEPLVSFQVDSLTIRVFEDARSLGEAAAAHTAESLRMLAAEDEPVSVIFATGASQVETLRALTSIPDLPWSRTNGFHMDEYVGISDQDPASFRRYLRECLTDRVPLRNFYVINGDAPDPAVICREYAELLRRHSPRLCLLGVGENGHLAFNDPAEAKFDDPEDVRVVSLDSVCRQQQVNEGWFKSVAEVPERAITLTIPALTRVPELILSVPGTRKARIVKRALEEPISTACPATILRQHRHATVYLDRQSTSGLQLAR
jgi:glucosamine-6-phosphate deaminase